MSLILLSLASLLVSHSPSFAPKLSPLHTKGNQILDSKNKPILLRGVNVACMEWSSDGEGHVLETVRVAVEDWHANHIRLPMSEDRWFGKAPEQKDNGVAYRDLIHKVVDWCGSHSCYVMLDMHWNDADEWGKNIGQHQMPDMNTLAFWKECAKVYKNNPAVWFDLYNEPHDITWDIWKNGGEVVETKGPGARQGAFKPVTYKTPGMQKILDTIRELGARNLVIAGGLDWSYDLSGFLKGYQLTDSKGGQGVVYACHDYPIKGDTIEKYLTKLDAAMPAIPIIMSEFGAENRGSTVNEPNAWVTRMLKEWDDRKCNWTAWDLHPAAGPCLLQRGWEYKPSVSFGVPVKENLAKTNLK